MAKPNSTALAVVSQDIEAYSAQVDYSREQVELIKDTYAKGATDGELRLFLEVAKRKGLDIFSKQICLVPRWDKDLGRYVKDPQTTVDGYRLIAERTDRYAPGQRATYEYKDGHLVSATAYVKKLVAGEWHEVSAEAFWDEYVQTKKDGSINPMWKKMPHLMLSKCAESLALRRAFPAELSGIYTQEEMGSATIDVSPEPAAEQAEAIGAWEDLGIVKFANRYEVTEGAEVFTIQKGYYCTCGKDQQGEACNHRAAIKGWTAKEASAPPPIDAEVEPAEEPATDEPQTITKAQLISLCELTKQMEAAGIEEITWRDQLENICGSRSRKGVMQDELAKVIFSFNNALTAQLRKGGKARAK